MSESPAIALIEFSSVAAGTFAADAMAKEAVLTTLEAGTVHRGHYLVLIGGGTAEVERSFAVGIRVGSPHIVDEVLLCDAHPQVVAAVGRVRRDDEYDSMAVLETTTTPSILRAVDPAVKGAEVNLAEMRLADGLGGKGIARLTGERHDVEAAAEIAIAALAGRDVCVCHSIVSRVDGDFAERMKRSSRFNVDRI